MKPSREEKQALIIDIKGRLTGHLECHRLRDFTIKGPDLMGSWRENFEAFWWLHLYNRREAF